MLNNVESFRHFLLPSFFCNNISSSNNARSLFFIYVLHKSWLRMQIRSLITIFKDTGTKYWVFNQRTTESIDPHILSHELRAVPLYHDKIISRPFFPNLAREKFKFQFTFPRRNIEFHAAAVPRGKIISSSPKPRPAKH